MDLNLSNDHAPGHGEACGRAADGKTQMRLFARVDSKSVEEREFQLAIFSLSVTAVLVAGLAIVMYPSLESYPIILSARALRVSFLGFCGLSALLLGYLIDRQITVRRLRREIRQTEQRYRDLHRQVGQDLLGALSGMKDFQDRLMMEFRRAANARDTLSVMVIRLNPNPNVLDPAEITGALGDVAKAIIRKLRREDSLYLFSEGAFGTILPGVNAENVRIVGTRVTEGVLDASGAVNRFTHDMKIINYPQHAATASELDNAVRSLLPEMVSETSFAAVFEASKTSENQQFQGSSVFL